MHVALTAQDWKVIVTAIIIAGGGNIGSKVRV